MPLIFFQCVDFKELVIDDNLLEARSNRMAQACLPLRGRDAEVLIGGV